MRKLVIWYPLLFSINVFLTIYVSNINYIPLKEIILPIIVASFVTLGIWWLLAKLFKDEHRTSYTAFLTVLWFSYYGSVRSTVFHLVNIESNIWMSAGFLLLWTLLFGILGCTYIWSRVKKPETITAYMATVGVCVTLLLVYRYAQFKLTGYDQVFSKEFPQPALHYSERPDIYYIILDGYSRADVLENVYDYDNGEFLEFLKQRGFYIASGSRSNYIHTVLSLSSSLNMEYLPKIGSGTASDRTYLKNWIDNSAVMKALQEIGYHPVILPSGFRYTEIEEYIPESLRSHYHTRTGYLELLWMVNSVIVFGLDDVLVFSPIDRNEDQQARILADSSALGEIASQAGPKFVFWHLVAPHPPFIFDETGPINPNALYFMFDGKESYGTSEIYKEGYIKQLIYINHLLMTVIDKILQNSEIPPIIILQGDHGGGANLDFFSQDNTCLYERFGILNAYFLPGIESNTAVYPTITPVNSFRVIFNVYFDAGLSYIDDASYFSDFDRLYDYVNVTDSIGEDCSAFQK